MLEFLAWISQFFGGKNCLVWFEGFLAIQK
jgi:hypothetical protein